MSAPTPHKILAAIQSILGRGYTLYAVIGLLFFTVIDHPRLEAKILNQAQIPIDYLVLFSQSQIPLNTIRLRDHRDFYLKVYEHFPPNADVNGMLGFCYHYLGNPRKALNFYQTAHQMNPEFFWFSYNLGVLAYQQGDYALAVDYFQKAINSDPTVTMKNIFSSWVYRLLDDPVKDTDGLPPVKGPDLLKRQDAHLTAAYKRCYEFIILSFYQMRNYASMGKTVQAALESDMGDKGTLFFYLGLGAYHDRHFDSAIIFFQQSMAINPRLSLTPRYLQSALLKKGKDATEPAEAPNPEISTQIFRPVDLKLKIF